MQAFNNFSNSSYLCAGKVLFYCNRRKPLKRESGERPELFPQLYASAKVCFTAATVPEFGGWEGQTDEASQETCLPQMFNFHAFG